ncbi:hypothetical protein SAMN05216464_1286 [Mucilaginibacter pineti]|uniref:Uncharacterized protein n=1 Tax=Mucilaginibacter pineti TaxID=1391627 RepID=A0A1G7NL24_9SPHI|nr:hypothetical protein [Mucilaginibacter pineti]SDF74723.1 hypothetical protein SAMN05216464_1286 [Mucilaginibacter pineti]
MNASSPWTINTQYLFEKELPVAYERSFQDLNFKCYLAKDSAWLVTQFQNNERLAFRAAYSPNDILQGEISAMGDQLSWNIRCVLGEYQVKIGFPGEGNLALRLTTTLKTARETLFPFWPRDIVPLPKPNGVKIPHAEVHVSQVGSRSGQLFFSIPDTGSVFYFQDLSSLCSYCHATCTSAGDIVGGNWPEVGLALPVTKNKPLPAGETFILSDAYVAFSTDIPGDEFELARQYLDLVANVYLALPIPETSYNHWPEIAEKALASIIDNKGCWFQVNGKPYLNAYVCDYKTPPEIMVQLAVLLPMLDHSKWTGQEHEVIRLLRDGLPPFYHEKLGTISRWLPASEGNLDGEEEQLQPMVMDAWYLHHPLLNLSRMALDGDKTAKKLFLDSIGFAIKVAKHFKYEWPVFYKMDTLEVVKAETAEGKGGEKDVPGLYAHVMLQAWELTKEEKYLTEAKRSAKKLKGNGLNVFYQANNTAFSAGALLRLWKITGEKVYKELSYLCLAGMVKNLQLWNCNYGYGKYYPTFFGVFPLNDAPYTAAYEEQEVFSALHEYLRLAEGEDIPASISLLAAEFIRYLLHRGAYYFPPNLPKEMLSDEVKTGEIDPDLWIPLEDMGDGWTKSGSVGQEVYGAGIPFGIVPRHYFKVPGEDFMVYVEYPTAEIHFRKGGTIHLAVRGDARLACNLMIIKSSGSPLPVLTVTAGNEALKGHRRKDGHIAYRVQGNQQLTIHWKKK